jgi:folate-dependent phosphoribosylglycinamide formyltransferase PurN
MAIRLRLAYITSVRELTGNEQVGRLVVDPVTGEAYGYRASTIERLAPRLHDANDPLAQTFELAAVVIDDSDRELAAIMRTEPPWPGDAVPRELLLRMPSSWRRLKAGSDETTDDFRVRKQAAKARYESDLCAALERRGVDVIVADSYMVPFGATMLGAFGGRILNVHPGLLEPGHPAHTPGHMPTRDTFTRAVHGFVIVDDKRTVMPPPGEPRVVDYEGARRIAVAVPRVATAGVSVHLVTETVDGGPILAQERWTFDPAHITPERIRHENYAPKYRVLSRALARWAAGYLQPSGVDGQSPMRRAPIKMALDRNRRRRGEGPAGANADLGVLDLARPSHVWDRGIPILRPEVPVALHS